MTLAEVANSVGRTEEASAKDQQEIICMDRSQTCNQPYSRLDTLTTELSGLTHNPMQRGECDRVAE